jgi:DNA replication protein DnaC
MIEHIKALLERLHFKGMSAGLEEILVRAEQQGLAINDVLIELLEAEYRDQQERALQSRIQRAKLPWNWSLDSFPFKQQPSINKAQIMGLAKLNFIQRNENLIFIGKAGVGKSGIAISLLRIALINGYRGRFYNAQDMLNDLYASLADRTSSRLLKTLSQYDLLVVDELGYLNLTEEQINIFFKLIDMRYQKKATIITTNLDFEAWYTVFKQKELVDAMLDRFKHHCTVVRINGSSLRAPQSSMEDPKSKNHKSKKE